MEAAPGTRGRCAAAALALAVLAAVPVRSAVGLVAYALGRPDSPRVVVGAVALVALALAAVPLYAAGRLLDRAALRVPAAVPVLAVLLLVPLVVQAVPLQYDQGDRITLVPLATAGVVVAAVTGSARWPARAVPWAVAALGVLVTTCVLMDLLRG